MGIIRRLPIAEIQKIAAGEVVERPANVVKELVENALDAGATQITVIVEDGGKKLIRVIDNGSGMDPDDAVTCFEHHATSKISSVHDLAEVATFGFRGEALSSIAAVSQIVLVTKQATAPLGIRVELEAGNVRTTQELPCPDGTDITVRELLFNVPARRKFLRTTETEARAILQVMQAFCLAYPQVHFSYTHEGYQLVCASSPTVSNRVAQLWPQGNVPNLLELAPTELLSGVISDHSFGRFDRNWMFFFVNGRWIKNFTLARAVMTGFAQVLATGKYPVAVIALTVPPDSVDINVHPRKEELVFVNPRKIEHAITQAVKKTLEAAISQTLRGGWQTPQDLFTQTPSHTMDSAGPFARGPEFAESALNQDPFRAESSATSFSTQSSWGHNQSQSWSPTDSNATAQMPYSITMPSSQATNLGLSSHATQQSAKPPIARIFEQTEKQYQLIGQLHKTYLLLEHEDGLLLIDQHAAHERIVYERLDTQFAALPATQLIFPEVVELSASDITMITEHLVLMQQYGFGVEVVGPQQLAITATPVAAKGINMQELLQFLVSTVLTLGTLDTESIKRIASEKLRAQIACKTAVKAGDVLSVEQMQQLLADLFKCPNRFSCPHGRPTSWLMATHEIEKKFKRDYR